MTDWLTNFVNNYLTDFVVRLLFAALIIVVGFSLVSFVDKKIGKNEKLKKRDENASSFLVNFCGGALRFLVIITAIVVLGVPQATVVAVIGSCGVTIGLGLQGGLSNIAGGLVIMLSRPFKVGDYISGGGVEGVVSDIGIYYTKIITPDNHDISVPNSTLSNSTINNLSTEKTRRIDFDFNVAYKTDIDLARKVLLATAAMNDMISKDIAPEVFVSGHGDSAVVLKLRVWCDAENYWTVYFDMWEDVKKAFDKFEIEIPYNHLDVTVKN
jgi:small conductance mechanosensitive channel